MTTFKSAQMGREERACRKATKVLQGVIQAWPGDDVRGDTDMVRDVVTFERKRGDKRFVANITIDALFASPVAELVEIVSGSLAPLTMAQPGYSMKVTL